MVATGLPAALMALLTSVPTLLMAAMGERFRDYSCGVAFGQFKHGVLYFIFLFAARQLPNNVQGMVRTVKGQR